MKDKIKSYLGSEKGMRLVNVLVVLSLIMRNSGAMLAACVLWIIYLYYSKKRTSSKVVKLFIGIFTLIAVMIIAVNFYFMVRYYWG